MDISNVTLVEIDENRIVVLDGKEYLVVDRESLYPKPQYSKYPEITKKPVNSKNAPKFDGSQARKAIIEYLNVSTNLRLGVLLSYLNENGIKITSSQLRGLLQRMKMAGEVKVTGDKRSATWALSKKETAEWMFPTGTDSNTLETH